jgi:tetratricopeptide (TPR) repeat protein
MNEVDGDRVAWKRRLRVLLAVPLAALAVVAVLWLRSHPAVNGMQAVVAASAALDYRPSLARLSADFPYREVKPPQRGADTSDTSAATAPIWALVSKLHDDGGSPHALGVSLLLVGRAKDAAPALEEALRSETKQHGELAVAIRRSNDAALLNDLAVTYLALADPAREPLTLDAVQRAWAIEHTPAIAWTRAVVIDAYHIRERSIAAWRDYLALEPRSQWSGFARQRLAALQQPTESESWPAARERLLAAGVDDPALFRDVDRFRQEVRLWCEEELLPKWGDAVLRDDPSAAMRLEKIRAIGGALEKASGERAIADAVEAIIRAKGETLRQLAKGHAAYGAGLEAEKHSTVQEAATQMVIAAAAFDPRATSFGWRARIEHAGMLYSSSEYKKALSELQELERECDSRLSTAGGARLQTLLAVAFMQVSSYNEAATHYTRAEQAYSGIGEHDYESALLIRLAEAFNLMGDRVKAREYLQRGLEIQERSGEPTHGHYALIMGALEAMDAGQQAQAGLFLDALVEIDTAARNVSQICTSTMWRSAYRYRIGEPALAASDLALAQRACASVQDRAVRERQLAYLEVASAIGGDDHADSPKGLDDAIQYFDHSDNRIWLSTAYFARARRLARRGDVAGAERDFLAALRETDANRAKIEESPLRVSFTATADEITDGYVEFLLRQRRERDAFETSDGRRVRELVDSPNARWRSKDPKETLPDIQGSLSVDSALIEYRVLRDRVIAWVITPDRFETLTVTSEPGDVIAATADVQSNASYLYDALLRPLDPKLGNAKALVIVPDDELERVAFSALRGGGGRPLLETRATAIAPSAALFARSRARALERATTKERVVVVKAASGDAELAALPAAAEEAMSIARLYGGARVIDGLGVSSTSLLDELKSTTVLQFVGHTVVDADRSSRTLRLGESQQARLGTENIAGATMPKMRLVYLSACETDKGPVLKSEGSMTLARSFFAAGVPQVVGTLWPIDDEAAQVAASTFHKHLLRGDTPGESLRQAQLVLLHRGVPFRDWASLRLIGAGF